MRIAYLIMTHENPQLLQRTIRTLSFGDEECGFFIHLDRKTRFEEFSSVTGQNIQLVENRIPVYWGEFSQVDAIVLSLQQAMASRNNFDYFVLLSGSDYPLRSGKYIAAFLETNQGTDFMDLVKMPAPGKPISRIKTLRYQSDKPVRRFAARVLARAGFAQRDYKKYLGNLEPYSGGTWWALTRDACQHILKFMENNPHVARFFQDSFAPDESYFHTILGNSRFAPRIRRSAFYTDWSARGAHPEMIADQHVVLFESQDKIFFSDMYGFGEMLFARKFNDRRQDIVMRVDAMIERKEGIRLPTLDESKARQCVTVLDNQKTRNCT